MRRHASDPSGTSGGSDGARLEVTVTAQRRAAGKAIMLQGVGSDVGKSVLTAGLCRIARRRGLRVAPFKPRNMSNNAAVTPDGGEIGRAQALQARPAGLEPHTDFNPVLLKPQSDRRAQVIVHGRVAAALDAADYIAPGQPLPRDADVILLLGRKSTQADLTFLRAQGWDIDILAHARAGGRVLGLCGGYQMLGRTISDPDGVDGDAGSSTGLGLLDIHTRMMPIKSVGLTDGIDVASGERVSGYEIHAGDSTGADCLRPMLKPKDRADGAVSADGRVAGCYLHGLFASDGFRRAWLESVQAGAASGVAFEAEIESAIDALADHLEASLDVDGLFAVARRAR